VDEFDFVTEDEFDFVKEFAQFDLVVCSNPSSANGPPDKRPDPNAASAGVWTTAERHQKTARRKDSEGGAYD
jgi:hypothetical protein